MLAQQEVLEEVWSMKSNHLSTQIRVKKGKEKEAQIIQILNENGWPVVPSTDEEDKVGKIDAWYGHQSVQIKYREGREDLGIALIKPWTGNQEFLDNWLIHRRDICWDRDFIKPADYYVCASTEGIVIVHSETVKTLCIDALFELYWDGGFPGVSVSTYVPFKGAELKRVQDAHSGELKVICYLQYLLLREHGAFFIDEVV